MPGIDDIHLVYKAVAIPVVAAEIHLVFHRLAGLGHHFAGVQVIALPVVSAIVGVCL